MPLRGKAPGRVINSATGQPASFSDPCIERGVTIAYNAEATDAARVAAHQQTFQQVGRSTENERAVNIHRRVKMGERPCAMQGLFCVLS